MKEKLFTALKSKFAGISDAILTRIAEKKAISVTDENQIQSVVDSITFDVILQSEVDSRITDANKKAVENYEKKHNLKEGKPVESGKPNTHVDSNDMPEWAKVLHKQNEELTQRIAGFEMKEKQQNLTAKLLQKMKENKIPEKLLGARTINDESEIDTVYSEIETTYNEIRQNVVNENVQSGTPGAGSISGGEKAMEGAIKDWASKNNPVVVETKK